MSARRWSTGAVVTVLAAAFAVASFGSPASAQPVAVPKDGQLHIVYPPNGGSAAAALNAVVDHARAGAQGQRAGVTADVVGVPDHTWAPHGDTLDSHGPGMALLFWLFAAGSIAGALFVITRRNLITAVMGMVGSFLGIAAIYMMLYAHFLSVVQMLVYAGAIMVLFVFVIMILNRPEDEPVAPSGRVGQVIGGIAIVYLVGRLIMILVHVHPASPAAYLSPAVTAEGYDWGSVKAVGSDLFGNGLFPFEAISILLLVAVVGAIAIARPIAENRDEHDPDSVNAAHGVADPDAVRAAQTGAGGHS